MEIIPTQDHLLIEPEIASDRPFGNIIIPDKHIKALSQGKVMDKGPSCSDTIKIGDTVCYSMHSDTPLNLAERKRAFAIVPEHQVLCIIRKGNEKLADTKDEVLLKSGFFKP